MDVLKRFPIKYVRDYIKKDYKVRDKCYICGSKDDLELHHLYSLSQLWQKWCIANNNSKYLNNKNLYTLCRMHHSKLHTLYGQNYSNHLVPKVKKWLDIQKDKLIG